LGAQKAELVTFRIGEHVPSLIAPLPDIGWPGTSSQQPRKLSVLITVSRIDVEVQTKLASLETRTGAQHDRGLHAAESGPWRANLDAALHPFKLNEPEHLTPERRQPGRITAVNH
jgi:hypothetical protein